LNSLLKSEDNILPLLESKLIEWKDYPYLDSYELRDIIEKSNFLFIEDSLKVSIYELKIDEDEFKILTKKLKEKNEENSLVM